MRAFFLSRRGVLGLLSLLGLALAVLSADGCTASLTAPPKPNSVPIAISSANDVQAHLTAAALNVGAARSIVATQPAAAPAVPYLDLAATDIKGGLTDNAVTEKTLTRVAGEIADKDTELTKRGGKITDLQTRWDGSWFAGKMHVLFWWVVGLGAAAAVAFALIEVYTGGAATGVLSSLLGWGVTIFGGIFKKLGTWLGKGIAWVWKRLDAKLAHPALAGPATSPPAPSPALPKP